MRAQWRFRSAHDGIVTRHALSAGAHYDPQLLSVGPVVGCDLHEVAPGAGFDWHAHRGVVIVSRVLEGTLRHEDSSGEVVLVPAGARVLVQSAGEGIRHRETNASDDAPLLFVQTTLLLDAPPRVWLTTPPAELADGVRLDADEGCFAVDVDGAVVVSVSWSESISAD